MPLDLSHLNPKQRQFVELVARGSYISAAYADAGFVANSSSATQLAAKLSKEIQAKVEEIVAATFASQDAARLEAFSKDRLIALHFDNYQRAMQAVEVLDSRGKPTGEYRYAGAVATASLEQIGKLLGYYIDRSLVATFDASELRKRASDAGEDPDAIEQAARTLLGIGA